MLSSRFGIGLERFINRIFGPRLDAAARYRARVVKQAADGTLEVVPDSAKLPPLTAPIHYTVPGVTVTVSPGAVCDLMFIDGDLENPRVVGFESGEMVEVVVTATTKITLNAPDVRLADGDRSIACAGDVVAVTLPFTPVVASIIPITLGGVLMPGQKKAKA